MAGLTKEQRAQREAAQKTQIELVVMVTDYQMFPGAPTIANVHPDEVDNWKAMGWKTQEKHMITYVTCDDVDNAFGNAWTSENAKNKAVLMANAWLNGFNLKINPSRIPEEVKLAGAYAARIASFGKLFQQKNDSGVVISKAVSADGVSVSKSFSELPANSTALLEPDLQLAIALLKPYGLSRSQVRVVRGG